MRIIVYGSLRREQGNSHWMTNAQWLGEYKINGYELYDLGHYPAVIIGDGEVNCEVYRIDSSILSELDELKANTRDYRRQLISTPYGSAWLYLYQLPVEGLRRIHSGDWLHRDDKDAD